MNCYETIYIIDAELGEEAEQAAKDRVAELIDQAGGRIYSKENWGKKRLAYEIRKHTKGVYQLIRFICSPEGIAAMERNFRLDEAYLKFLTIRLSDDPDTVGELVEEPQEGEAVAVADAPATDSNGDSKSDSDE